MTSLQIYVARLAKLVELAEAGDFRTITTHFGVCFATESRSPCLTKSARRKVDNVVSNWEHYSGYLPYPIPVTCSRMKDAQDQYTYTHNLWEGEQLAMRISYMKHLIKELS